MGKNALFKTSVLGSLMMACIFCIGLQNALSAPPEGKGPGNGNSHGKALGLAAHGGGGHGASRSNQGKVMMRGHMMEHINSNRAGGRNFHAKKFGDFGERTLPDTVSKKASFLRNDLAHSPLAKQEAFYRKIVRDLQDSLDQLHGKENARWNYNPKDERGQGNMGKVDMLDPYGFAKDDRKEIYGNNGRVIRESEEPEPEPEPRTITITDQTYQILQYASWNGETVTTNLLLSEGYSLEEAQFLLSLSLDTVQAALTDGYILWP